MVSNLLNHKDNFLPVYFQQEYLNVHRDSEIVICKNNNFRIPFTLDKEVAYSFRQSPFGSFFMLRDSSFQVFEKFEEEICQDLLQKGIRKIIIRQPPEYYQSFIPSDWLVKVGFSVVSKDINQYIPLFGHPEEQLHKMEERKLRNANKVALLFSHDGYSALEEIHAFIAMCRADAGLSVNISLDKLHHLFQAYPSIYGLYTVRKGQEILAACVTAQPVPGVYYYYLPATHPNHKSKSPMVLLMVSLAETFQSKGGRLFDLGLSSVNGEKQKGLYGFKKRMGALETSSLVCEKIIG